jgi:aconitate hydratase 2/2-methylisocitrate dehydratase
MQSWANAEWFLRRQELPEKITLTVFKVAGETNTDDLSPAPEAWSRPDIPLHALSMLSNPRDGVTPDEPGSRGPLQQLQQLKKEGYPLVYVGDVVGTGSSRKSATNSILWHIGNDIPWVPNKRNGGFVFGGNIAPSFSTRLRIPARCR